MNQSSQAKCLLQAGQMMSLESMESSKQTFSPQLGHSAS